MRSFHLAALLAMLAPAAAVRHMARTVSDAVAGIANGDDECAVVLGATLRTSFVLHPDERCKCPFGHIVSGPSKACKVNSRYFNPNELRNQGCYCQRHPHLKRVEELLHYGILEDGLDVYSGYVPVPISEPKVTSSKTVTAELFTLFVRQARGVTGGPLLLWFNGGPGCSSLGGALMGVGPFFLDRCHSAGQGWCPDGAACKKVDNARKPGGRACDERLVANPYSWHEYASLLFLETPPTVGFSGDSSVSLTNWRKYVGQNKFKSASQKEFGKFHARAIGTIVEELEKTIMSKPFSSILLSGESFAGIYLTHVLPPLLEDPEMSNRVGGVLIGNPKLSTRDRLDASPEAFVRRCIQPPLEFEALKQDCNGTDFSSKVDLSSKKPDKCTKAWVSFYNSAAQAPRTTGVSWYNADYKCETCGRTGRQDCSPLCFDTSAYERYLNKLVVQRQLGIKQRKWEFCKDVGKWIEDFPMVEAPPFVQEPEKFLRAAGKQDFKFWLFSGDSDLESLHEASLLSMRRMFGEPRAQVPWQAADGGGELGDFVSFAGDSGARLVRMKGGGHIATYYATQASVELFRLFVSGAAPASPSGPFQFVPPKVGNCSWAAGKIPWAAPPESPAARPPAREQRPPYPPPAAGEIPRALPPRSPLQTTTTEPPATTTIAKTTTTKPPAATTLPRKSAAPLARQFKAAPQFKTTLEPTPRPETPWWKGQRKLRKTPGPKKELGGGPEQVERDEDYSNYWYWLKMQHQKKAFAVRRNQLRTKAINHMLEFLAAHGDDPPAWTRALARLRAAAAGEELRNKGLPVPPVQDYDWYWRVLTKRKAAPSELRRLEDQAVKAMLEYAAANGPPAEWTTDPVGELMAAAGGALK